NGGLVWAHPRVRRVPFELAPKEPVMFRLPVKWRQWSESFIDSLLALWEHGTAWLFQRSAGAASPRKPRASLEVQELEARWCPAPVAVNDSYSVHFNTTLNVNSTSGVLANDTGGATSVSPWHTASVAHGTLMLNYSTGAFTYTPTSNYVGTDSFV